MPIVGPVGCQKKNSYNSFSTEFVSIPNISTICFKTYLMGLSCFSYDKSHTWWIIKLGWVKDLINFGDIGRIFKATT